MKKLLVIETDGMNEIVEECAASDWYPIFIQSKNYRHWLPAQHKAVPAEIRSVDSLSYFDIVKLIWQEDIDAVLPISLLEPEGVRDSLVKDYITNRKLPINIVANSSATMESTFDKFLTKEILSHYQVAVTPSMLLNAISDVRGIEKAYGYPVVIKERKSYTGMGVKIFNNSEDLTRYATRNIQKGLFAEPFIAGSEVSMEVIVWNGEMIFQPLVYKGETRLNIFEHPAYRPRIAPFKKGSALEEKLRQMGAKAIEKLQLEGVAEFEFLIVDDQPFIMEINPRLSGVTRLCHAAGGVNAHKELAHMSIHNTLRKNTVIENDKYAIQLPLNVLPEGEFLKRLQEDPHISYIKPITWMPILPIRSSIIVTYQTKEALLNGIMAFEQFSDPRYMNEAYQTFEYF